MSVSIKPGHGDYLASMGNYASAEAVYRQALSYIPREKTVDKALFIHVYHFFKNRNEEEKAAAIVRQALAYFPDDAKLKRMLEPTP